MLATSKEDSTTNVMPAVIVLLLKSLAAAFIAAAP